MSCNDFFCILTKTSISEVCVTRFGKWRAQNLQIMKFMLKMSKILYSSFLKVRFRRRLSSAKICTFGRSYFGSGFAWQKYSNHPITGYARDCYDTHFFQAPSIRSLSWTNILKEPFNCFVLNGLS